MSVYVDGSNYGYGRMVMCHMIADTPDELHAMADRIGVARRWFQDTSKASFPHYDIAKSKRALAVAAGAIECDRATFVGHVRRLRPVWGVYGPGNPAPTVVVREAVGRVCEGTIHVAPGNAQCLACGLYGQRCERTGR